MKAESRLRAGLFTVGFMFAITFVFVSAVAGLHLATKDVVARNANLHLQRSVMIAAGLAAPVDRTALFDWYGAHVTPFPDASAPTAFRVRDDAGAVRAYVFRRSGPGLWGRITAIVGLAPDLRSVTGVTFTEQNETPGLGARIEEPWFKRQFEGRQGPFTLVPEGTRSTVAGEVDGITGATITSAAVRDIVNGAAAEAAEVVRRMGGTDETEASPQG